VLGMLSSMMNIESCPICNQAMQGIWSEVGEWQAKTAVRRVFKGWECASGCHQGRRAQEWLKAMQGREGISSRSL
jgi:hypothetical protein